MSRLNDELFNNIDPDINLVTNIDSCRYFNLSEFNSFSGSNVGNYLLLNQNMQSFDAKKPIFEAFLDSLSTLPHTIVLTETWMEEKYIDLCVLGNFSPARIIHTYIELNVAVSRWGCLNICKF